MQPFTVDGEVQPLKESMQPFTVDEEVQPLRETDSDSEYRGFWAIVRLLLVLLGFTWFDKRKR